MLVIKGCPDCCPVLGFILETEVSHYVQKTSMVLPVQSVNFEGNVMCIWLAHSVSLLSLPYPSIY